MTHEPHPIRSIYDIHEQDEPPLCPCGGGYVGHPHPAVIWCQYCPEPATGDDELCTPHRLGVPAAITDPWLAQQWLTSHRWSRADERLLRRAMARAERGEPA